VYVDAAQRSCQDASGRQSRRPARWSTPPPTLCRSDAELPFVDLVLAFHHLTVQIDESSTMSDPELHMNHVGKGTMKSGAGSCSVSGESSTTEPTIPTEIADLHARCGIYTRSDTVTWFLNQIGWVDEADLATTTLLEPSAGDGAFLVEAIHRLCRSFHLRNRPTTYKALADRITAFEIHHHEAAKARHRAIETLSTHGIAEPTAHRLAAKWIQAGDFLATDFGGQRFTHVASNPPYIRWSHIPTAFRTKYEKCLPRCIAKGDLCLAFLGKCLNLLAHDGRLGFLCSDRWLYAAYGEDFRRTVMPSFQIETSSTATSRDVFEADVSTYPIKLIVSRSRRRRHRPGRRERANALRNYASLRKGRLTLKEAGFQVRVGPALGMERIFTGLREALDVEDELLRPYLKPRDLSETAVEWSGCFVICMHDDAGKLRNLADFPRLSTHLHRHRQDLEKRSIIKTGTPWYRPIDRVLARPWSRPKLLLPEMTASPRAVLDTQGRVPSHGIYAIFDPDDDITRLASAVDPQALRTTLEAFAPQLRGRVFRCYKKFIELVPFST